MDEAVRLGPGLGVLVQFESPSHARRFRDQCYNARRRAMRQARKLPPTDAAYCRTPWAGIVIARGNDHLWIGLAEPSTQEPMDHE